MKALVSKSTGSWYSVITEDGKTLLARTRGKLRQQEARSTNPVAVGDRVMLEAESETHAVITAVLPRKNYVIRKSANLSRKGHILAANLDQALLLVTISRPTTLPGFIDRFLVSVGAYHIPCILVFHKTDQYTPEELNEISVLEKIYTSAGYTCLHTSIHDNDSIEEVKKRLKNKISLLSGFSGVGKSSMINSLNSELHLKTGEISEHHHTGKHTTTFAEMHSLPDGGYIIDTPGVRAFGLIDLPKENISHYFPEMLRVLEDCRFHNCMHINEPGCAVKKALELGEISALRYKNYLSMLQEDEGETYRSDKYA